MQINSRSDDLAKSSLNDDKITLTISRDTLISMMAVLSCVSIYGPKIKNKVYSADHISELFDDLCKMDGYIQACNDALNLKITAIDRTNPNNRLDNKNLLIDLQ